jgi:hypothetical protein
MVDNLPPTLEYEPHSPPRRRPLASATFVCWLGLLGIVAGMIVVITANQHPADRGFVRFGVLLSCFGVTWWVLGLILREALRRSSRG